MGVHQSRHQHLAAAIQFLAGSKMLTHLAHGANRHNLIAAYSHRSGIIYMHQFVHRHNDGIGQNQVYGFHIVFILHW